MVVVSGVWVKNVVSYPINGELITTVKMAAKAVLICRPNSHPFQERTLSLEQPVKIGRSVARARAVPNNAIFDCKVLSRNHALLWYENGKFYLQDTKSSNGTFVNNQRLSKGAEESPPREVCSGDIVQFGVDVMENARKVTHGCIVATVKLYLPDGKEAKASPSTSVVTSVGVVPLEDLYQLNIFLQEALQKEHMLESKLATLQKVVESTRQSSELAWKALIDEDRLLSRVETLETQLLTTSKNFGEDKLREELRKLQDDKHQYQGTAKESLQKILEEKLDVLLKLQALELSLSNSESECAHLKQLWDQGQQDLQELAQKFSAQLLKAEELTSKMEATDEQNKETVEKLELEKLELQHSLEIQTVQSQELQLRLDALHADGNLNHQRMSDLQSHLQLLKSNEENDGDSKEHVDNSSERSEVILDYIPPPMSETTEKVEDLQCQLQACQDDLQTNKVLVVELKGSSENITEELVNSEDDVQVAKVRLETIRSEESLVQEKAENLQERIDDIGLEIELVTAEIDTNKCEEGYVPDNTGQVARLKAERLNLQELLAEVRTKKKILEDQKEVCEQDLNAANMKVKYLTEESNILKQQLLAAETLVRDNEDVANGLRAKIEQLQLSLSEHATGMGVLQNKLAEEVERADKSEQSSETLKEQHQEAAQSCKYFKNQCKQWEDRYKTLQVSHAQDTKAAAAAKEKEVGILKGEIAKLKGVISELKDERTRRIALAKDLEESELHGQELLRRLDVANIPRDVGQDKLEEELVEIKTNFARLLIAMGKVEAEFVQYRRDHPNPSMVLANHQNILLAITTVLFGILLVMWWY